MALPKGAYFESIRRPTIEESAEIMQSDNEPCWIDPLLNFLKNGKLPAYRKEARKIKYTFPQYFMHEGKLYKRSFSFPLLICFHDCAKGSVL